MLTVFQMWERRSVRRLRFKDVVYHTRERVDPEEWTMLFGHRAFSAGKVLSGLDYNPHINFISEWCA